MFARNTFKVFRNAGKFEVFRNVRKNETDGYKFLLYLVISVIFCHPLLPL